MPYEQVGFVIVHFQCFLIIRLKLAQSVIYRVNHIMHKLNTTNPLFCNDTVQIHTVCMYILTVVNGWLDKW